MSLVLTDLGFVQVFVGTPAQTDRGWRGRMIHPFAPADVDALDWKSVCQVDVPRRFSIHPGAVSRWQFVKVAPSYVIVLRDMQPKIMFCPLMAQYLVMDECPFGQLIGFVPE